MNLAELETKTTVSFDAGLSADQLLLNDRPAGPHELLRVAQFLDIIRSMSGSNLFAQVTSKNNFPAASGIASSASAFAALALAASTALGLSLSENELSRLARRGSGSASRSIPTGFTEWLPGQTDDSSFSISIAKPEHWDLVDVIAIVDSRPKNVGSTEGHHMAITSPLQSARVNDASRRVDICRKAVLERDFSTLLEIIELDCHVNACRHDDFTAIATLLVAFYIVFDRKGRPVAFKWSSCGIYDRCWSKSPSDHHFKKRGRFAC